MTFTEEFYNTLIVLLSLNAYTILCINKMKMLITNFELQKMSAVNVAYGTKHRNILPQGIHTDSPKSILVILW